MRAIGRDPAPDDRAHAGDARLRRSNSNKAVVTALRVRYRKLLDLADFQFD
jgi:hypothetical protein